MSFDSRAGRALRAVAGWLVPSWRATGPDGLPDCQLVRLRRFSAERRRREQALLRASVHLEPAERGARAEALFRDERARFEYEVAQVASRSGPPAAGFAAD